MRTANKAILWPDYILEGVALVLIILLVLTICIDDDLRVFDIIAVSDFSEDGRRQTNRINTP